jgi:hypothetical protein
MAGFWQMASMLREQVNATAWRSDVLKPLAWLIAMLVLLVAMLAFAKAPEWLLTWVSLTLLGTIILYALSYAICFFIDRDALRSEGYSLNKMAIEHKLIGDSSAGMFSAKEVLDSQPVPDQSPKRLGRRPSPKQGEAE